MNVHELFTNLALSREVITLILKFAHAKMNAVHELFTNKYANSKPWSEAKHSVAFEAVFHHCAFHKFAIQVCLQVPEFQLNQQIRLI